MERAAGEIAGRLGRGLSAVLWGVTPEIAGMRWPPSTRLTAIELAADMIQWVWPGDRPGIRRAIREDWIRTPDLLDGPVDLVIGDGCFNTLAFPQQWRAYAEAARRALTPQGCLVMRFYVQLPRRQILDEVLADLRGGRTHGFHVFKFQLAMAMQADAKEGVRLHDVWELWRSVLPEVEPQLAALGWSREMIETIEVYRGQQTRYWFPTFEEVVGTLAPLFRLQWASWPDYEMGDRCPVGVFQAFDRPAALPDPHTSAGTSRSTGEHTP
jgi:hypothetical protein